MSKTTLRHALAVLKTAKSNDRSELDRRYAILITELEKVLADYLTFVVHEAA